MPQSKPTWGIFPRHSTKVQCQSTARLPPRPNDLLCRPPVLVWDEPHLQTMGWKGLPLLVICTFFRSGHRRNLRPTLGPSSKVLKYVCHETCLAALPQSRPKARNMGLGLKRGAALTQVMCLDGWMDGWNYATQGNYWRHGMERAKFLRYARRDM
jgi:hypothetical protein